MPLGRKLQTKRRSKSRERGAEDDKIGALF